MFARNMPNVLSLDSSPFAGVSNVTSNVDLLLINFENAATNSGDALKGDVPLKCDPSYVPLAKANNNTVASLANNHASDYGTTGLKDTISYLKEAGITPIGAGENEDEAHQAVTQDINGRKVTILNYMDSNNFAEYSYEVMPYANGSNPGYSAYDSADAQKQIAENNDSDSSIEPSTEQKDETDIETPQAATYNDAEAAFLKRGKESKKDVNRKGKSDSFLKNLFKPW